MVEGVPSDCPQIEVAHQQSFDTKTGCFQPIFNIESIKADMIGLPECLLAFFGRRD